MIPLLVDTLPDFGFLGWWNHKFNAPKWLQDCMLSVELRWHTNKQIQCPGGKNRMKYLISDYKPALFFEVIVCTDNLIIHPSYYHYWAGALG